MSYDLSRRDLLVGSIAATAAGGSFLRAARAEATTLQLRATTRNLDIDGKPARVFGLIGPDGKSGLTLAPGKPFRVDLTNTTDTPTIIHWHGQLPPWMQDGVPWAQTPPLAAGAVGRYDFQPIAGTYWMHSHLDLQEQRLMTAPLIVQSPSDMREDRQDIVVMLHDFSFRPPAELLAGLTGMTPEAAERMSLRMENLPSPRGEATADNRPAPDAGGEMKSMQGMEMSAMDKPGSQKPGQHGAELDLNDIDYDAYLANDRTFTDPEVIRVEAGARLRLRIINAASASQFWINLGALEGQVVAADGHPVQPVAGRLFPISTAQRLDILLNLPGQGSFPVIAQVEGKRARTGLILATKDARITRIGDAGSPAAAIDNSLEGRLSATEPLAPRKPDLFYRIVLSGAMKPYAWALNGHYWPDAAPYMVRKGQRVEVELVSNSMMAHPIHLHGHAFQVIALDGKPIVGAVRDTILVPPMTSVRFAFDADNPGRWAFHCHNLYHFATGMMAEFRYEGVV